MIKKTYLSLLPFLFVIFFISDSSGFTIASYTSNGPIQLVDDNDSVKSDSEKEATVSSKKKNRKLQRLLFKSNTQPEEERKTDPFGIVALICGIGSFFIFGIILAPLAVIFSIISFLRISKKPYKRKGKVLATIALTLGVVAIGLLVAYFASL